jgi:hypothetical protein
MNIATVFESSEPVSMIRRQRGMISVESKKWMTVLLSFCCIVKLGECGDEEGEVSQ